MKIRLRFGNQECTHGPCDVLVLKYPQAFQENAAHTAARDCLASVGLTIDPKELCPHQGLIVDSATALSAKHFCLYGVEPIGSFRFQQISLFIEGAFRTIMRSGIRPRSVGTTMHGIHTGLDEYECLKASIKGLVGGLSKGLIPDSVEEFIIFEPTDILYKRFEVMLLHLVPSLILESKVNGSRIEVLGANPGELEPASNIAFVAMPFDDKWPSVFEHGIRSGVRRAGCSTEIVNREKALGDIRRRIHDAINRCDVIVADVSGDNPNVLYEIGYAHGIGKQVLLITRSDPRRMPFDIRTDEAIRYRIDDLPKLSDDIKSRLVHWALRATI